VLKSQKIIREESQDQRGKQPKRPSAMRYASLLPPPARRSLILALLTPTTTAARQYSRRWSIGIGIVSVVGALHSPSADRFRPPSSVSVGRTRSSSSSSSSSSAAKRAVIPFAFTGGDYSGEIVAAAEEEEPLTGWLHNTRPKYRPPTVDDAATRR
jgi:hypothetical protein